MQKSLSQATRKRRNPRVSGQQRIPRPLKGSRVRCVSPRKRHRKEIPLSPLRESRRRASASREELVAVRDKQFSTRWQAHGRIACNVTPTDADRRKVASGKSGVLRSSCLRIDPIGISFKPRPHRSRRVTSGSRCPVPQTSNYSTTRKTFNERQFGDR